MERRGKRGSKPCHQIVYYLSSRQEIASVFARKIRGHWHIENRLHWVKDVLFQEDASPIHRCQPACNISTLKTIAINLLRSEGRRQEAEGRRFLGFQLIKLILAFSTSVLLQPSQMQEV